METHIPPSPAAKRNPVASPAPFGPSFYGHHTRGLGVQASGAPEDRRAFLGKGLETLEIVTAVVCLPS
jgi:hypothetical protein